MMRLKQVRTAADELLAGPLQNDVDLFEKLLDIVDDTIAASEATGELEAKVSAIVLLKARRLSEGIFAMALEALGQEAGALFRVLQEAWELLMFMEQDPSRAARLATGKKPGAGKVAKAIGAEFKNLRDHLNEHASHISFSFDALGHTVDLHSGLLRLGRRPGEAVVRQNLSTVFAVLLLSVASGLRILSSHDSESHERLSAELLSLREEAWDRLAEMGVVAEQPGK